MKTQSNTTPILSRIDSPPRRSLPLGNGILRANMTPDMTSRLRTNAPELNIRTDPYRDRNPSALRS